MNRQKKEFVDKKQQRAEMRKKTSRRLSSEKEKPSVFLKNIDKKNYSNYFEYIKYGLLGASIIAVGLIGINFYENFSQKSTKNINQYEQNVNSKNTYIEPEEKAIETLKREEKRFEQNYAPTSLHKDLANLSKKELVELNLILSNYDLSSSIRDKATNKTATLNELYQYKGDDIEILDQENKQLIQKGYRVGKSFDINQYGVLVDLIPYTQAWRSGLKNKDKVIGINEQVVNTKAKREDIHNALFNSKFNSIRWYRGKTNQQFLTKTFQEEPLFGEIGESYLMNDVLLIKLNKVTVYTPNMLYQFIKNDINKVNGIVLDFTDLKDQSYRGADEIVWLLNGQKNIKYGEVLNHLGQPSDLIAKPVNFTVDPNVLARLNAMNKVILVNYGTSGSPELIAQSIQRGIIAGKETRGNDKKDNFYQTEKHIIKLTNNIIRNKNSNSITLHPKSEIYIPTYLYYGSLTNN